MNRRATVKTGLLATAAALAVSGHAWAQASCVISFSPYTYACTVPAGTYDAPVGVTQSGLSLVTPRGMGVPSAGTINVTSASPANAFGDINGLGASAFG